MPEEEDLFEEETKNEEVSETDAPKEELDDMSADDSPAVEAGLSADEVETEEESKPVVEAAPEMSADDLPAVETEEEPVAPEDDMDKEISIEDESPEESQEEKPFTIAALATAKKKQTTRTLTSKLGIHKEKKEEEVVSNIPEGQLAIDVYETPKEIIIKSTIAGVKPEDLDVGIEDNTVNIRGSRHNEEKVKGEDYFYQECYWGTFSRSVILPTEVDGNKAQASLKDGILTVRLPKIIKEKEKKIKIIS